VRNFIDKPHAENMRKDGALLGKMKHSKRDKDFGWEVVAHKGRIIACCIDADGHLSHGKEIFAADIPEYCDEPTVARWAFENGADIRTHPTCTAGGPKYLAHLASAE